MARNEAVTSIDPESSAAFRLGFYSRYFDLASLTELLKLHQPKISRALFDKLKSAVNVLRRSFGWASKRDTSALAALADKVLGRSDPNRPLYDLGAALGDYSLEILTVDHPDLTLVWDRVTALSNHLAQEIPCLNSLVYGAKGGKNLEDAMRSAISLQSSSILEDDQDRQETATARAEYRRLIMSLPRDDVELVSKVVPFVARLSQELMAVGGGTLAASEKPRIQLRVDVDKEIAYWKGEPYKLPDRETALYLAAIVNANGNWVGPKELADCYPLLKGARPDRLKTRVPFPIRDHIDTKSGKGSRFLLAALHAK